MTCIIICFKPRNTVELQAESGKRKLEEALSTEGAEDTGNSDKKKAKRD
jgi:protein phosphatase 1G